jgi:hypothetical protein
MARNLEREIIEVFAAGKDLTLATVRPDGSPQATTVSYASDGLRLYFGCGEGSQKARNLGRDDRVSLTINLPYADWSQIRGASVFGRARRLTSAQDVERFGALFLAKFPEVAQYVSTDEAGLAMFEIRPEVIALLDYREGFGHQEQVRLVEVAGGLRVDRLREPA